VVWTVGLALIAVLLTAGVIHGRANRARGHAGHTGFRPNVHQHR
jgi:hypothetical protein